jgi:hypothetical protein
LVVNVVETIQSDYKLIKEAVEKVKSTIEQLNQPTRSWGDQSAGGLIQDVEQNGFDFEKQAGWSAKDGMNRSAYLTTL